MKRARFAALALLALGCAGYMKVEVEGRVLDESGRPVANAEVTTEPWYETRDEGQVRTFVRTDAEGRFAATLPRSTAAGQALFAQTGRDRGGFVVLPGDKSSNLEIVLRPLILVRAELDASEIPPRYRFLNPYVHATGAIVAHQRRRGRAGSLEFRLPPGSYQLMSVGCGKPASRDFEVPESGEVDLGSIPLEPYKFQTLLDRPAPELHIADAQRIARELQAVGPPRQVGRALLLESQDGVEPPPPPRIFHVVRPA